MANTLAVEVVHAGVAEQVLLALQVPPGTTALQAVELAGLAGRFPELDLATAPMGIFGKLIKQPAEQVLEAGDRVEVYRPLLADPMEVRRQRAARAKAAKRG
ncbi:RnfH family protein [Pseudomonas sp. NPDC007930]|uniref:RnfH family protein n=1 Tax=Pseudomonas sp. NPDC007930 TaxID=3364417 RepID=UPI0036EB189F